MVVLPGWLDQVPKIDFGAEKAMLTQLETWAQDNGWTVTDGADLPSGLRERTDVLLAHPDGERRIRVAVLQKSRSSVGYIRLDASNLRTLELEYRRKHWRVLAGAVPIEDDIASRGWNWLVSLLFKP
jgi:hypothetical protein